MSCVHRNRNRSENSHGPACFLTDQKDEFESVNYHQTLMERDQCDPEGVHPHCKTEWNKIFMWLDYPTFCCVSHVALFPDGAWNEALSHVAIKRV